MTFWILLSSHQFQIISEIGEKFFTQSEAGEDRGWSILSKSIIRHQNEFIQVSIIKISQVFEPQITL